MEHQETEEEVGAVVELQVIKKERTEEVDHRDIVIERWVHSLLDAEFYIQCYCGASTRGETNMFCSQCEGVAFCERCRNDHDGPEHNVIQVYRSSHATCFRKDDIEKTMDISLIQSFINNSYQVIYIRPRRSNGHRNGVRPVNRCVVCSWELKREGYKYCSISCKVQAAKTRKGWKVSRKGTPSRSGNYGWQRMSSPY